MKICLKNLFNIIYFVLSLLVWRVLLSATYRLLVNSLYEWLTLVQSAWRFSELEIKFLRFEIALNIFIYVFRLVIGFAFGKSYWKSTENKVKINK